MDGLILDDGTEVHLPPHLGAQLVAAVKPGDVVTIHGLRARAVPMVQAVSITNDATGKHRHRHRAGRRRQRKAARALRASPGGT